MVAILHVFSVFFTLKGHLLTLIMLLLLLLGVVHVVTGWSQIALHTYSVFGVWLVVKHVCWIIHSLHTNGARRINHS